ncbi:PREDICTED: kunitz-type protease inhibitor AFAPI-I-like [Wasmannia auropunctata]|uniref:kunitz-type protease inhibitor AFAPI-I-like n=1 Tax=Wasmannia auropunctata TaxID=64793 RepID=UPI0005EFE040|nr:PREDICTED: kunitz-type protease inhibitor AFAPI-I-like [Wasmannia auropunctata]
MDLKLRLFLVFVIVILTHETVADRSSNCLLPIEKGSCRAYITRYAYNSASGKCERFIYTGCDENANNFKSMAQCEETCVNV